MKSARVFDLLKLKINYFLSFIGYKFEKISSSEFEFFRISKRCEKAISDFIQSRDTLDLDKINKLKLKVLHLLNEMVLNFPASPEAYFSLAIFQISHLADPTGYENLRHGQRLLQRRLKEGGFDVFNIEFIPRYAFIGAYGFSWEIYILIKAKQLCLRSPKALFVCLPKGIGLRNASLYGYFSKFLHRIEEQKAILSVNPMEKMLQLPADLQCLSFDGTNSMFSPFASGYVEKRWFEQGNPPLFTLEAEHKKKGDELLLKMGLSKEDWFVCLHMREPGYRECSINEDFRNVNPFTYFSAIQAIIERGGWVMRLGDPSVTRLPKMDRMIDYAHSEYKSDWMDVYLSASCKFIIGTGSGGFIAGPMFGKVALITNLPVTPMYYYSPRDFVMPRLCRRKEDGRVLSFSELLSPPVGMIFGSWLYKKFGIEWIENTEDELKQASVEVLDHLENKLTYSDIEDARQLKFREFSKKLGSLQGKDIAIHSRIPRYFLSKHALLLESENDVKDVATV